MKKQDFVYCSPDTSAGKYLRQFWQPIFESNKLDNGQAFTINVLGESFCIYRGETGTAHVTSPTCPHRQTVLSTGWIEGDSIRCFYHGWQFDSEGKCIDQPAEPKKFCHKVNIQTYPVKEYLGFIFVYFGEGEPPEFQTWPEFETNSVSSIANLPCNYFQSAENIMDDVHVGFTHSGLSELSGSARGYQPPMVRAEETEFGMIAYFKSIENTERNMWIMPNICCVGYDLVFKVSDSKELRFRAKTLFWYVPIDDENHMHVMVTNPGSPIILREMQRENSLGHSVSDQVMKVLRGESKAHMGIPDPGTKRTPDLVRTQDAVAIVGQGKIADRSLEQLGASDAGIVMLRRLWNRQLKHLDEGTAGKVYQRPENLGSLLEKMSQDEIDAIK